MFTFFSQMILVIQSISPSHAVHMYLPQNFNKSKVTAPRNKMF